MVYHITTGTSVYQASGDAFSILIGDNLIVDANAFLISESGGNGATLKGEWTVVINGALQALGGANIGFSYNPGFNTDVLKLIIGRTGDILGGSKGIDVFASHAGATITNKGAISGGTIGIFATGHGFTAPLSINNSGVIHGRGTGIELDSCVLTLVNSGTISGTDFSIDGTKVTDGIAHITNFGTLSGPVFLGQNDDIFTDFKKVGHVIKSGTAVSVVIDLGGGADHFNGGANSEIVRDGEGADTINFGAGNDFYFAVRSGGGTDVDIDIVNGGSGVDTYDALKATATVTITLGGGLDPPNAQGAEVGFDAITGFENAIGGSGDDVLIGSNGANILSGGVGFDHIIGGGGRDILQGDANGDIFVFGKLSDSGVKAATRDVIIDFDPLQDSIDLSFIDANSKTKSLDDPFHLTGNNGFDAFSHHAGELRQSFSGGDTIVSGDVNGDGKADFSILLKNHHVLHDTDFVL